MSFVDLENLSPQELIAQYVLECRGQGHCLPYEDYEIIAHWLKLVDDPDELLVALSEDLPKFFESHTRQAHPPPLKRVRKLVEKKLRSASMTKR